MIEAGEYVGVAGVLSHHLCRAMTADVVKAANDAIGAANQQQGLASDPHAAEVARLLDLALVAGKLPDLGENLFLLLLEDASLGEDAIVQVVSFRKLRLVVAIQRPDHARSPRNQAKGPRLHDACNDY